MGPSQACGASSPLPLAGRATLALICPPLSVKAIRTLLVFWNHEKGWAGPCCTLGTPDKVTADVGREGLWATGRRCERREEREGSNISQKSSLSQTLCLSHTYPPSGPMAWTSLGHFTDKKTNEVTCPCW